MTDYEQQFIPEDAVFQEPGEPFYPYLGEGETLRFSMGTSFQYLDEWPKSVVEIVGQRQPLYDRSIENYRYETSDETLMRITNTVHFLLGEAMKTGVNDANDRNDQRIQQRNSRLDALKQELKPDNQ